MDPEGAGFPAWLRARAARERRLQRLREREGGSGSAAAGGSAWEPWAAAASPARCPPSATMPGIDKLPIEETLEDSPQVRRRGRRREARVGAAWADPGA